MSKGAIAGIFVALVAVLVLAFMVWKPVTVFGVTDRGLVRSIEGEIGDEPSAPNEQLECVERGEGQWRCSGRRFGSDEVTATLEVDDDGCWEITAGFGDSFVGRNGCISVLDATGAL